MGLRLDTTGVAGSDRAEAIRELIWSEVVRVEITHHPEPERIFARGAIAAVGGVNVCSVRSNATTIRRTTRLATDDLEPSIFIGLQVSGSSVVVQHGREAILQPGHFALYDTTTAYTLLNDNGIHQHFFRVRERDLALPAATIRDATAIAFAPDDAVAGAAATFLQRLATIGDVPGVTAASLSNAGIELIRAVIAHHAGDDRLRRDIAETSLVAAALEYARSHLGEHDLSASRIAAAVNVSVRQLYTVLAQAGVSLGDWIRESRLEACRRDLTHADPRVVTIAAIARRWGFVDPTHFGRAFKRSYGLTPKEWRDQHPMVS